MQIIDNINHLKSAYNLLMGAFDGIHLGHQAVLKEALAISQRDNLDLVIITFNFPPKYFFRQTNKYLLDVKEKCLLLEELGINKLIVLDFDQKLAAMNCEEFFENYLESKLLVNFFWGHDFAFGKDKNGDLSFVQKKAQTNSFTIHQLPIFFQDGQRVSSSTIREMLLNGQVDLVKKYLGREYNMHGKVVAGYQLGRQLGFPTANLNWDENKLLPKTGVYHTITSWRNQKFSSITNIGHRPSVKMGKKSDISIETHLINFCDNLYGENINLQFVKRVRDEIHFDNYAQLAQQIQRDIEFVEN